jgi:hypothetical protein
MSRVQDNIANYNPPRKGIIFKFIQDISSGTFTNQTDWGLEVRNQVEDIKTPRWGIVERLGPDVPSHIKVGSYILIKHLQWTENFKVDEVKWWGTNYEQLLATSEVEPKGLF